MMPNEWRALSLWQPWLWLVLNGLKPIENRKRNMGLPRLPFLLHASLHLEDDEQTRVRAFCAERFGEDFGLPRYGSFRPPFVPSSHSVGGYCGITQMVGMIEPNGAVRSNFELPEFHPDDGNATHVRLHGFSYDLRWWMREQFAYLLGDVRELPFVKGPGKMGFFKVPPEIVERLGLPPTPEEWSWERS